MRLVAESDPGGLTIGWVSSPSLPARLVDRPAAEGVLERLALVGAVQREPVVFVSCPRTQMGTVADLLRRSGGQEAMALGTPPEGSPGHLVALRLQVATGVSLNIVPFPSPAAARQAAQSGHVAAAALAMGDAIEALRDASLTGLGVAAKKPSRSFPSIAPVQVAGIDFAAPILRGLALPAGAPEARVAALRTALQGIVADPEFVSAGQESGFQATYLPGDAWAAQLRQDQAVLSTIWQTTPWTPPVSG